MDNKEFAAALAHAMEAVAAAPAIEVRGGKKYVTVAQRVMAFRKHFPNATIATEVVGEYGSLIRVKATIKNRELVLATGHAEEDRSVGRVNSTSALENAETSAIGRALAALGLSGGEFASADEVSVAIQTQNLRQQQPVGQRLGFPSPGRQEAPVPVGPAEQWDVWANETETMMKSMIDITAFDALFADGTPVADSIVFYETINKPRAMALNMLRLALRKKLAAKIGQ